MRFDFIPFFNPGENIPWIETAKISWVGKTY